MLEFNTPVTSSSSTGGTQSASNMLSMLNMNIQDAANRQNAFVLGNTAPLAALHTMTEMKSAMLAHSYQQGSQTNGMKQSASTAAMAAAMGLSPAAANSLANSLAASGALAGTPHGINDILSRSTSAAAAAAAAAALGTNNLSRMNALSVSSAAGMYFNPAVATAAGFQKPLADFAAARQHLYWPSMLHNHSVWRDRFCGNSKLIN